MTDLPAAQVRQQVYIGVYSDSDKKHIGQIEVQLHCKVHIYDAKLAKVWR